MPFLQDSRLNDDQTIGGVADHAIVQNKSTTHRWIRLTHFATKRDQVYKFVAACGFYYNGAIYLILMQLASRIVETYLSGDNYTYFVVLAIIAVVVNFGAGVVAVALSEIAAERQQRHMKMTFFAHLMKQEMHFFDNFDSSVLATQLNYNSLIIRRTIGSKSAQVSMYCGIILFSLGWMFKTDYKLAALSLALVPLILVTGWFAAYVEIKVNRITQNAFESAASVAREAIQNIKTIKAFGLEITIVRRFTAATQKALIATSRGGMYAGAALGLHWAMIFASLGFGIWYGTSLLTGESVGPLDSNPRALDVFTVYFCVINAAFAMSKVFPIFMNIGKAKSAMRQVLSILSRTSCIDSSSNEGITDRSLTGDIRFRDVAFTYNTSVSDAKPVFAALNLHIPAGETTALVGTSGGGKSTVVQLLERFYDPQSGSITIDNIPTQDLNVKYLRSNIGLVSQEPRLFADTIAANIACGRLTTRDEIIDVAMKANAHTFISQFPEGYDTWVGEGGAQLSGGQKQRIAIARALLKDPKILILDEATSALDNESEKIVQDTIDHVLRERKRTCLIIAHRLTTIRQASKIVVLANIDGNGAVVAEEGTHAVLVAKENGLYAALVAAQLGNEDGVEEADWTIASPRMSTTISHQASMNRYQSKLSVITKLSRDWDVAPSMAKADSEVLQKRQTRRTLRKVRQQWTLIVIGIIATVIAGCVWPAIGYAQARIVDCFFVGTAEARRHSAQQWSTFFYVVAGITLVTMWASRALLDRTGANLMKQVRVELFDNLIRKNVSYYDNPSHCPGAMVHIMSEDVMQLGGWGGAIMSQYITTFTIFLISTVIFLIASWKLGLIMIAGISLLALCSYINIRFVQSGGIGKRKTEDDKGRSTDSIMVETILNMRTVTAFNLQEDLLEKYKIATERDYKKGLLQASLNGVAWGTSQTVLLGLLILSGWYAIVLLENEAVDPTNMIGALLVLLFAAFNLNRAFVALTDGAKAKESATKIYTILDDPNHFDEYSTQGQIMTDIQEISFHKVAFRYFTRPDLPIYRSVTLTIPKGKVTALVGASGCGKSTAIQLLQHLYAIGEGFVNTDDMGNISYNGNSIGRYNIQSLRRCIGIVSQEPALFWGTIEENIAYGKEDATPDEIEAAAKAANAWDFIQQLPEGIHTSVGEGGGRLSGGQKQRIAIARALIRSPKLLILDEATSALDTESEKVVQATLDELLKKSTFTTIIIAHRLSTIRKADQIIVFSNADCKGSRIAEVGNHKELMSIKNGLYRSLVRIAEN